uniref:N-terminal methionine N(alpha)-acetyltransferase NatE n=1 Tax=Caenorhabditis tropicalis TaxID=1561998 RepID=A0A1I7UES6_9PELO
MEHQSHDDSHEQMDNDVGNLAQNEEIVPDSFFHRIQRSSTIDRPRVSISLAEIQRMIILSKSFRFEKITNIEEMNRLYQIDDFAENSGHAYFDEEIVGLVCSDIKNEGTSLFIREFGVWSKYRRRGVAGALLHHIIYKTAESMENIKSISLHVWEENLDAIRLIERFGFVRWQEGESNPNVPLLFVRPVHRMPLPSVIVIESIRVGSIMDISPTQLKTLNTTIFGEQYYDSLHRNVIERSNPFAFATLNDAPIGSIICETSAANDLTFLDILKLGTVPVSIELAIQVQETLVNQAFNMADSSIDVDAVTYYVQNDQTATIHMLTESGFKPWLPIPDFYRQNTYNHTFFIKETTKLTRRLSDMEHPLVAVQEPFVEVAGATKKNAPAANEKAPESSNTQRNAIDLSKLDITKLDMKNRLLRIENITKDTVEVMKRLISVVSPTSADEFNDVFNAQSLTYLAFFDEKPIGYIHSEMKQASEDTNYLSIVTLGVLPEFRRYGVGGELIKHLDKLARETYSFAYLSTIVPEEDMVATRLFLRCDFKKRGLLSKKSEVHGSLRRFIKSIIN